jgi:hypothetical protein
LPWSTTRSWPARTSRPATNGNCGSTRTPRNGSAGMSGAPTSTPFARGSARVSVLVKWNSRMPLERPGQPWPGSGRGPSHQNRRGRDARPATIGRSAGSAPSNPQTAGYNPKTRS